MREQHASFPAENERSIGNRRGFGGLPRIAVGPFQRQPTLHDVARIDRVIERIACKAIRPGFQQNGLPDSRADRLTWLDPGPHRPGGSKPRVAFVRPPLRPAESDFLQDGRGLTDVEIPEVAGVMRQAKRRAPLANLLAANGTEPRNVQAQATAWLPVCKVEQPPWQRHLDGPGVGTIAASMSRASATGSSRTARSEGM